MSTLAVPRAQDVTPIQHLHTGDIVTWRTAAGYRTSGRVESSDGVVARVRTHVGGHIAFGLCNVAVSKLTKENPL